MSYIRLVTDKLEQKRAHCGGRGYMTPPVSQCHVRTPINESAGQPPTASTSHLTIVPFINHPALLLFSPRPASPINPNPRAIPLAGIARTLELQFPPQPRRIRGSLVCCRSDIVRPGFESSNADFVRGRGPWVDYWTVRFFSTDFDLFSLILLPG